MNNSIFYIFKRDVKKTMNLRTWLIWTALAAIGVFFFYATPGKTELLENGKVEFMTLFLPQIIFGTWAVLSSYFDLISSDREHNVLDCILCSGISKTKVFASKMLVITVVSLILSFIYLAPVTCVIIEISRNASYLLVLSEYLIPLWGYIMVYAALGVMISVVARSSKSALIWSLAIGLILMPRFFIMIIDVLGNVFNWTQEIKNNVSLAAPGVMLQALSDVSDVPKLMLAATIFSISILVFLAFAYFTFIKQDEYNYGE